jgi:GT2 family glycosyltransferase
MSKLPVVAAVANYNMALELGNLLPQLTEQGYSDIFVLDDASVDDSHDVVSDFSNEVIFVPGQTNEGAGANRNRIIGELGYDAIIHFLDADVDLKTRRSAEVISEIIPSEPFGFIGGLAKTPAGYQSVWNYGPRQSLRGDIGANLQAYIDTLIVDNPERAIRIRARFGKLLEDWPNPLATPIRRQVFWCIEQSLVISSDVFTKLGGFDESLREHEIQDLAIRMKQHGLKRYFDPLFSVQHTEGEVRNYNRRNAQIRAEVKIQRKQGIVNWLLPDGRFKAEL